MVAFNIKYSVKDKSYEKSIDARDIKSAKKKLGKIHGYTTGNMIKIQDVKVIGYY